MRQSLFQNGVMILTHIYKVYMKCGSFQRDQNMLFVAVIIKVAVCVVGCH